MSGLTLFETNEKVRSRVKISLLELGYPQLASVTCEAEGATVFLNGEVGSFYLAQVARSIAKKVPGVRSVVNHIRVAVSA